MNNAVQFSWLYIFVYYLAQVFFIVGSFFWIKRTGLGLAWLCFIGFLGFLSGNLIMIEASRMQVSENVLSVSSVVVPHHLYSVGRFLSASGLLMASVAIFSGWYSHGKKSS